MTLEFLDPRAQRAAPPEAYALGHPLDGAVTIGLLANGFPDSVAFLDAVADALGARLPAASFRRYDKGNPSIPASADLLTRIADECDVVASAYGH